MITHSHEQLRGKAQWTRVWCWSIWPCRPCWKVREIGCAGWLARPLGGDSSEGTYGVSGQLAVAGSWTTHMFGRRTFDGIHHVVLNCGTQAIGSAP
jgi:hypothetical protein